MGDLRWCEFDVEALEAMVHTLGTEERSSMTEFFLFDKQAELNRYSSSSLALRSCKTAVQMLYSSRSTFYLINNVWRFLGVDQNADATILTFEWVAWQRSCLRSRELA